MKTSELTGAALDWAVAKCEGLAVSDRATKWRSKNCPHLYSTDWAKGGPIIEREWIDLHCVNDSLWEAECPAPGGLAMQNGPTPLVAVMRCYVASKLGHTVEIPYDLVKE
jgi:hypothetical protein